MWSEVDDVRGDMSLLLGGVAEKSPRTPQPENQQLPETFFGIQSPANSTATRFGIIPLSKPSSSNCLTACRPRSV